MDDKVAALKKEMAEKEVEYNKKLAEMKKKEQ